MTDFIYGLMSRFGAEQYLTPHVTAPSTSLAQPRSLTIIASASLRRSHRLIAPSLTAFMIRCQHYLGERPQKLIFISLSHIAIIHSFERIFASARLYYILTYSA